LVFACAASMSPPSFQPSVLQSSVFHRTDLSSVGSQSSGTWAKSPSNSDG
ncbi:hypothetical protein GNI_153330, partial [Gregarina niphandrodes]